ncbi:MAG TPA: outer membrane beta-barrel protein [Vicinamibacterales bacterium]|nr:outer membrane beta-barrel protein [Vicinamibacterales bacterium]
MTRILCLLLGLAIPAVAVAQPLTSDQISDVRANARGHIGPFYFTPTVALKELGVDNNVFNSAGEPESDFTFTVMPGLNVWVPVARRALLSSKLGTDLVWYSEFASERSIDPQGSGRGEVYLNRITLFAEAAYLNTRQRPNYEIDIRSRRTEESALAGVQVAITPAFWIEVAGRRWRARYEDDAEFDGTSLQRTLNRDTDEIRVTARHRLSPLTTLAVRSELLQDRFEFSPGRDSRSYRIMPGVEFKPQALLSGSAYVGYRQFTPDHPALLPDFSGLVGQLGLSYTLLGATVFGVSYTRDLSYSYEVERPFFVDTSIGASVRRALGARFDVLVSADRHEYEYQEAVLLEPAIGPRLDVTWSYAGSLGYRIGRTGRVGFGVSYWQRESSRDPAYGYESVRLFTTASYGF